MRHRQTTEGGFNTMHDWKTYNTSGVITAHAYTYSGMQSVKTIDDVEVANFKRLLICGKFLPLNPVIIETDFAILTPGTGSYRDHLGRIKNDGSWQVPLTALHIPFPNHDEDLLAAATLAAMNNAASTRWDFSTFVAEYSKSARSVASAGSAFIQFSQQLAIAARQKSIRQFLRENRWVHYAKKNPWKTFQDLWLGARYTVRPMVYDALDAMNAMLKLLNGNATHARGTGTQHSEVNEFWDTGWQNVDSKVEGRSYETLTGNITYRGCSFIELKAGLQGAIQVNPLTTAWELTPWSFVYDWFHDVGSMLNALTPYLAGDFAGTMSSLKYELTWEHVYESRPRTGISQPVSGSFGPTRIMRYLNRYERMVETGLPAPPFNPRLTLPKIIDLVALLVRGKKRIHETLTYRR